MSGLFLGILCITKRGYQFRSFESLSPSTSSKVKQRIIGSDGYNDEDLGEKAREAKQRLDHRLRRPFRLPGVCRFLQNSAFLEDPAQVRQHFGESDQHKILVRLYLFVVVIKNRTKSKEERCKDVENGQVESNTLQKKEMIGLKQNGIKTFSRVRKQWEGSENDECTICLDQFKIGDNLIHLQCDHKFHSCCLVPWLENYPYCPCCRMEIVT